jgi:hypothetical protein
LLQANAVIWVEGPSDRIYLNYWLTILNPDLVEGIHYSIMFYGGRLLSHLAGDQPQSHIDDFIALYRINQHSAIVIDSDRDGPSKRINATKRRVRSEFQARDSFVWITAGREVENYLDPGVLKSATLAIHPTATFRWMGSKYEAPLSITRASGTTVRPDKVAIARSAVAQDSFPDRFDLHDQCSRLDAFLRSANGMGVA